MNGSRRQRHATHLSGAITHLGHLGFEHAKLRIELLHLDLDGAHAGIGGGDCIGEVRLGLGLVAAEYLAGSADGEHIVPSLPQLEDAMKNAAHSVHVDEVWAGCESTEGTPGCGC
jgi:hypothetical protein